MSDTPFLTINMTTDEDYYNNTDNKDVIHQVSGITARIEYYRDLLEDTYYSGQLIDDDFNKLKIVDTLICKFINSAV